MKKNLFVTVCAFAALMLAGCEGSGAGDNGNGNDNKGKDDEPVTSVEGSTDAVAESAAWATHVAVSGNITEGEPEKVRFGYRTEGGQWAYVDATAGVGGAYSAKLTGLTPAGKYEVSIEADGKLVGTAQKFTTEAATPIPNGGLEDYGTVLSSSSKDIHYFYDGEYSKDAVAYKFWDTGNEGSTLLGDSVTQSVAEPRTGSDGQRSARLKSAFIGVLTIGKFAAGNIYSGDYAETVGMSGGKVDFGQPFTSRPTAMKVWYKATPGTVDYSDTELLVNGATDKYRIYIALTTWEKRHQVYTGDRTTFPDFDKDEAVIAYGELVSSTPVADWTQATISLKYRKLDTRPTYIVIVASASMYGDYFTGSTSSVMYLDDFELVYDENVVLQ